MNIYLLRKLVILHQNNHDPICALLMPFNCCTCLMMSYAKDLQIPWLNWYLSTSSPWWGGSIWWCRRRPGRKWLSKYVGWPWQRKSWKWKFISFWSDAASKRNVGDSRWWRFQRHLDIQRRICSKIMLREGPVRNVLLFAPGAWVSCWICEH